MAAQFRHNGRIAKRKVVEGNVRRFAKMCEGKEAKRRHLSSELHTINEEIQEEVQPKGPPIEGIYMTDLLHLGKDLQCKNCQRTLNLLDTGELKTEGAHATLKIPCKNCGTCQSVETGKRHKPEGAGKPIPEINTNLVHG